MSGTQPDPNDYSAAYNTALTPAEEAAYQAWGAQQAAQTGRNPAADTYDYDMRGFWKSGGSFADNGHAGDQFKKPNHPTFSTFSQYNGADGAQGGTWTGGQNGQPWVFAPSPTNLQFYPPPALQQYFQQREPGNQLALPPGLGQTLAGPTVAAPGVPPVALPVTPPGAILQPR